VTSHEQYGKAVNEADIAGLRTVLTQSFAIPEKDWESYFKRVGQESFRIIRIGKEVVAGLAIIRMGQWFGGRSIPMAGVVAVGVAPQSRGSGVAARLMQMAVRELRADGLPLSVLYPATISLYRGTGYELAGTMCVQAIRASSIRLRERDYPMKPVDVSKSGPFERIAIERAKITSGNLDRCPAMWTHLTHARDNPVYGYLIGPEEHPDGYVLFAQEYKEWGYDLRVRDMAALSMKAGRRLWSFLASHSSQCRDIYWRGPLVDPLLRLLPEPEHRIVIKEHWMLRIIDPKRALAMRGYPMTSTGELHLDVVDDVLPENTGRFTLKVAGGEAEVLKGGRGDLRLDVRDLASIYTGMVAPSQLHAMGAIEAAQDAIATASQLFAGSDPWMADVF
jgi:predicted acetyltransferase